jgi:hypothetical protein
MELKTKKVCPDCGSDRVWINARADWNVEAQEWQLLDTHEEDGPFCEDCEETIGAPLKNVPAE